MPGNASQESTGASVAAAADGTTRLVVGYRAGTSSVTVAAVDHRHGLAELRTIPDIAAHVVTVP
ncbi:MAG TPA: hypothetical protein VGR90_02645, partial [Acidimicrobiales bacterium]|nr:hypothetical protein [Acidimicrobiales bacterium]